LFRDAAKQTNLKSGFIGKRCGHPLTHPQGMRFQGGFGIYDAPEPWGPWTTAFYTEEWDVGPGESSSLPTKWMSADGRTMHLVFSGNDSFSVRQATVTTEGTR